MMDAEERIDHEAARGRAEAGRMLAVMRAVGLRQEALGEAMWLLSLGALDWGWVSDESRADRMAWFAAEVDGVWPGLTEGQRETTLLFFAYHMDKHEAWVRNREARS